MKNSDDALKCYHLLREFYEKTLAVTGLLNFQNAFWENDKVRQGRKHGNQSLNILKLTTIENAYIQLMII